jgi:hypothetical protein
LNNRNIIITLKGHLQAIARFLNPPHGYASGGQKPFREKVSGLPKAFGY